MARSRFPRKLSVLLAVAVLASGLTAVSGVAHPVAADPILHGSCLAATPVSLKVESAPDLSIGMTTRPCDNNVIGWDYSSAYPLSCYTKYNGAILDVSGVCGYSGNLTNSFSYIIKITIKNYTAKYVTAVFDLIADEPGLISPGWQQTCTYWWEYDQVDHRLESPVGSCTAKTLIKG
jgi:hypothetical protein